MRLTRFLASAAMVAALVPGATLAVPFDGTNAGGRLYVCAVPQNSDLTQSQYEALAWTPVTGLGNFGEAGTSTNVLNYDTWDMSVVQKYKGMDDAGSPEVEFIRKPTDAGQNILRAAARTKNNYAFKMERPDKVTGTGTGTIIYNRGIVTGPRRPFGRNEDFDLEVYTFGLNQLEIVVNPTGVGNAPQNTVIPTITGTATVNSVLTAANGTWTGDATITYTYQWFGNGVAIPGATGMTYVVSSNDIGKKISVRVTGTNDAGSAMGTSIQTAAVA